jgi:hypothetical protein
MKPQPRAMEAREEAGAEDERGDGHAALWDGLGGPP